MAKILLRKRLDGSLVPMDDQAQESLKRIKAGTDCWCEVRVARDPIRHRRYFALLTLTFENQEQYTNFEIFRKAVQIAAGHVEEIITLEGEVMLQAKSICFEQLDEVGFSKVYTETLTVCAKILGDMGLDDLEYEVMRAA